MDMTYVKVYKDWTEATRRLREAEKGRLIDAMVIYATTGDDPSARLGGNEQYVWPMFQAIIDRDRQALAKYSRTQSENGSKGGRPRKNPQVSEESQEKPKNPSVFLESQKSQDKDKEYNNTPLPPKGEQVPSAAERRFDAFWKAYPKKVGKGAAQKAFGRLKVTDELLEAMLDAIKAQKRGEQWQKDGGQYIPNPSTWLNQRRWEDELPFTDMPMEEDASVYGGVHYD